MNSILKICILMNVFEAVIVNIQTFDVVCIWSMFYQNVSFVEIVFKAIVKFAEDYFFSSARNYTDIDNELEVIVDRDILI